MSFMLRIIFCVAIFIVSISVHAGGTSGVRELQYVKVVDNTLIAIAAASGTTFNNPDNCDDSSIAIVNATEPAADRKLTLALSAFMGSKNVGMWFDSCVATPWGYTAPHI